ncbi:MAG: eL32 family ribosomal protein [Candidatus Pacearchaeota archaeon]
MVEEKRNPERRKPKFLRKDWHKMIKLGSKSKSKRKWRASKGRQGKIRLERRGHQSKPKIGWGSKKNRQVIIRVENIQGIENIKLKEVKGITIGNVGLKKRKEIIAKANEKKIKILNKYKGEKDAAK